MSEEVELIVESLLGVLLRTILEISNRPQSAGPSMRLQFQDVTVRVVYHVHYTVYVCVCVCECCCKLFGDLTKCAKVIIDFELLLWRL